MDMSDIQLITAIDENYAAFQALVPSILQVRKGQFALLRQGQVMGYFNDPGAAAIAGDQQFPDGLFSVQEVMAEPSSLGFFSYAYDIRPS
jgi:membrane protease subunit (stomatin/prohibitin family)